MKRFVTICTVAGLVLAVPCVALTGQIQVIATDMTPAAPLSDPLPFAHQPRYISGFGSSDSFTLFFEDRSVPFPFPISFITTASGTTGFPALATPTNITDTHFCVKDWPINIDGTKYAYRAWGAGQNTPDHQFYVSNDLENWELISTFTIPTLGGFPGGQVYYSFHDVIRLNDEYYAWGECNIGYTLICCSDNGDDKWEAFDCVGGFHKLFDPSDSGLLQLSAPGTPTGSFFDLGGDRGYVYLAVNTAAKPSLPPAELEAAFNDPKNWTWHDGTTGLPSTPILTKTDEHDCRECWLVPSSGTQWNIIYDADFGSGDGGKALGYVILSALLQAIEVDIDIKPGSYPNAINLDSLGLIPVAILSSDSFNATTVNPETVALAGADIAVRGKGNKSMAHKEDVNGDGITDLVVQIEAQNLDPEQFKTGYAILTGETFDGRLIEGKDEITIVPPEE